MRIRLIRSAIAVALLTSLVLLGPPASAADDDGIPQLKSAPPLEDTMPRAQTGEPLPMPRLLRFDGPWAQKLPPQKLDTKLPTLLGNGGVQRFDSREDLDRQLQWEDFLWAFERLLQQLEG